jgi:hypothetical protein
MLLFGLTTAFLLAMVQIYGWAAALVFFGGLKELG